MRKSYDTWQHVQFPKNEGGIKSLLCLESSSERFVLWLVPRKTPPAASQLPNHLHLKTPTGHPSRQNCWWEPAHWSQVALLPLDREFMISIHLKKATQTPLLMTTFDLNYLCSFPVVAYHMAQQTNLGVWEIRVSIQFSLLTFFTSLSSGFLICNVPVVIFISCLWRLKETKCAKYLKECLAQKRNGIARDYVKLTSRCLESRSTQSEPAHFLCFSLYSLERKSSPSLW